MSSCSLALRREKSEGHGSVEAAGAARRCCYAPLCVSSILNDRRVRSCVLHMWNFGGCDWPIVSGWMSVRTSLAEVNNILQEA